MKLSLKNISKTFHHAGEAITLFSDLNLEVPAGAVRVIMGVSGCGKTTLLRMINGLEKPDAGEVLFDDYSMYKHDKSAIHKFRCETIGFADQHAIVLPQLTALENVLIPTLGRKGDWTRQAITLLADLGLDKRVDFFPHQLSGGELQRIAWARALILNPKLLLLDEPTSALDPSRSHALLSQLQLLNCKKHISIIIATHHTTTLDYFPHDIRLDAENPR